MSWNLKEKGIFFLTFVLIFSLSLLILRNSTYCVDDLAYNFLDNPFDISKKLAYGAWVMRLQYILMYIIPYNLGIDFQTWGLSVGTMFKALSFVLFSLCIYKLFRFRRIGVIESSVAALFYFILLFVLYHKTWYIDLQIFSGFFRFVIPSLIMVYCIYIMYKQFYSEKINILFMFFLGFICSYSSEVVAGILLTSVSLLLFYQMCVNMPWNINLKEKFNGILPYLSLFLGLISGLIKLVSTQGFNSHFAAKIDISNNVLSSAVNNLSDFLPFCFKCIIIDYWYIWLFIVVLIIFNLRHKDFKTVIYSLSIYLGIFAFSFSLIFAGKTDYNDNFWVEHSDIHTIFISAIVFSLLLLFLNLFIYYKDKKIFTAFFIALFLYNSFFFYNYSLELNERLTIIKEHTYLRDKMVLFYALRGETPILPITSHLLNLFFDWLPPVYHQDIDDGTADMLNYPDVSETGMETMTEYYYPCSYGIFIPLQTKVPVYLRFNDAVNIFLEKGGKYDEIKNNKFRFSDLKNKNFILNGR